MSARPADIRSGATSALALTFALRELRGGLSGFYIFLACIALGVAAISGVNAVALSITSGIQQEGRILLGGDVAVELEQRRMNDAERAFLANLGTVSESASMRAMARLPDGSDQSLIELKAVDSAWPLTGMVETRPAGAFSAVQAGKGVVVDDILLARLGMAIGDTLAIGAAHLPVLGTIVTEPDRIGEGFLVGPRVLMNLDSLDTTQLVQPGSLVEWTMRVVFDEPTNANINRQTKAAKRQFPQAGWGIRSRDNAAPALTRNVERFSQFLTLVGLTALIVGGVGVANAVRSYLDGKRSVIASFKALGAPATFVFWVYLLQILLIAAGGILIGLAIGGTLPFIARWALDGILPVGNASAFHPTVLLSAIAYGVLTALLFALWPLGQARDIPATALFRNAAREDGGWPRHGVIAATAVVLLALATLAVWQAANRNIALVFLGGIAVSFLILRIVSDIIRRLARTAPRVSSTALRLAIGNIHRPGALTPSVVLSLGLGLALLVALGSIDGNLRNQISANIPDQAPDFFFVDIQAAEIEAFRETVAKAAPEGVLQTTPMLRGRIVSINGVPASTVKAKEGGKWVLRGDRGITYSDTIPLNATLEQGTWWEMGHTGDNLVSFSAQEADEIGLSLGDKLVVNVLGRDIEATIANTRNVEWQSMSMNFVMVFSANTFAGAPHGYLATLAIGDGSDLEGAETAEQTARDGAILRAITNAFPTVTTIRVRDALTTVNALIAQLATAIRAAALLALVASILVLAGALAAGNRARIHDAVVLKTLGATRATLIGSYIMEYALLGFATAVFALGAGTLAAWFVISVIMGFSFTFLPWLAVGTVLAALVLTVGFGLVGTWRVLGQKAAPLLRETG